MPDNGKLEAAPPEWRMRFLRVLMATAFLLFFQAYMVAPLIPSLAAEFRVTIQLAGLLVPAYLLPYALGTFAYGVIADRYGRPAVLFGCVPVFAICCILTSTAHTVQGLIAWRLATGVAGGGLAVIALTLVGDLFPPRERGHAMGCLFGAIAGGLAFGSTLGGVLAPVIGWRGLFVAVGAASMFLLVAMAPFRRRLAEAQTRRHAPGLRATLSGYVHLLALPRGRSAYLYIFLNGVFHSGVFTWLGVYLADRYRLGEAGIGIALLGYGVPGFLFGPIIGRAADRRGRGVLIPRGIALAALAGLVLIPPSPLAIAAGAITLLSLGFDMSHPLLAGIVSSIDPVRRGQAMGLNTFALFLGFSIGSLLFGAAMRRFGFNGAVATFATIQLALAIAANGVFRSEGPVA